VTRSPLRCPHCKAQIGWRRDTTPLVFPRVKIREDTDDGATIYVCPECGYEKRWEPEPRERPKAA